MVGTDTGSSSCVSQEHNQTCRATRKTQQPTATYAGTPATVMNPGVTTATTETNTSTTAT
ncbi:hypothetical protein PF003_g922 [Phytophthora fragariae]|nr:hypothetical protein PF003_g922 [Phytophthora fragariae]